MTKGELITDILYALKTHGIDHPVGYKIYVANNQKFNSLDGYNDYDELLNDGAYHLEYKNRTLPIGYLNHGYPRVFIVETSWFRDGYVNINGNVIVLDRPLDLTEDEGVKVWNNYIKKQQKLELLNKKI